MVPGTASFWLISVWTLTDRASKGAEQKKKKRKRKMTAKTELCNDSAETTGPIKTAAKIFLRRLDNFLEPLAPLLTRSVQSSFTIQNKAHPHGV